MSNIAGIGNAVTKFSTGAVRDVQEDKGRCDLMPLDAVSKVYEYWGVTLSYKDVVVYAHNSARLIESIFDDINYYIYYGESHALCKAICEFILYINIDTIRDGLDKDCGDTTWAKDHLRLLSDTMLEVSKHYKEGTLKYGERNWEKGIPLHSYIDSATRHLIKHIGGYTDERHDRAFIWNLLCCIHTANYIPNKELRDLPFCTENTAGNEENKS